MNWNDYPKLNGLHAFLSPSGYHWINYTEEKLIDRYSKYEAAQKGTQLHDFATEAIRLGIKLPKTGKSLNAFVNDAIGYRMTPEVTLFYSENCFGTTDAIGFKSDFLRIHDLKTGVTEASITQLLIYACLFFLEYKQDPNKIGVELRIYQSDKVLIERPTPEDLMYAIEKIKHFDNIIKKLKEDSI